MLNSTRHKANGSITATDMSVTNRAAMLKEDIGSLRDDIRTTAIDLRGFLTGKARKSVDAGQLLAKGAGKRLGAVRSGLEDQVRARPLATVGLAFGAGVLIMMLSRRRG